MIRNYVARLAIALSWLVFAGSALAFANTGGFPATTNPIPHGRCMSAAAWNAPDGLRPCAQVRRVYEDGSVKLAVMDANGTTRYTLGVGVPNGYECRTGAAPAACR